MRSFIIAFNVIDAVQMLNEFRVLLGRSGIDGLRLSSEKFGTIESCEITGTTFR